MIKHIHNTLRKAIGKERQRICFIHIPKCAGTSLVVAFKDNYPSHQIRTIGAAHSQKIAEHINISIYELRTTIAAYLLHNKKIRFISGHIPWCCWMAEMKDWYFISLLRDPVQRWISAYFYSRHKTSNHCKISLNLDDFLDTTRAVEMGHVYTSYFLGKPLRSYPSLKELGTAAENLKKFNLIGFMDDFPEFLQQLASLTKISFSLQKLNVNPLKETDPLKQINDDQLAKIKRLCQPDYFIYQAANDLWR